MDCFASRVEFDWRAIDRRGISAAHNRQTFSGIGAYAASRTRRSRFELETKQV